MRLSKWLRDFNKIKGGNENGKKNKSFIYFNGGTPTIVYFDTAIICQYRKILEKQTEIDQYLFVDHLDELEEMGIHVTHTSPTDTYVEIGISPYSEEHAEYLTEIFGAEFVKVVEGEQAVTLTTGTSSEAVSPNAAIHNEVEKTSGAASASIWWITGIAVLLVAVVLFSIVRRRKQTVS